jgi:non-ribosomal peptide synthetase component E (peptide arylation enzyme)
VVCRSDLDVEGLKYYLKKHLPDYMIPNRFEKISEMPLTASGKADRNALPEPAVQLRAS